MQSNRFSTPKSYPRSARAETRNRAKDELKRVINAVERVRKWEKRWVLLKDSTIYIYKWVPVSEQNITSKSTVQKAAAALSHLSNSNENSNDASNTNSQLFNDESNTAFSEVGFDSDSNQAASNDAQNGTHGSTDFSALVREEKANKGNSARS